MDSQKRKRSWIIIVISLIAICSTIIGSTLCMIVVKSNKITNTFKIGEITYELILIDRPKEDSSNDEVCMPTITPENPYTDDVGYVDFTLNGIPTRSGYEFIGWYLEDSETTLYNSETTVIQVGYDDNGTVTDGNYVKLTLYAHWELVSDAIIYHANGGTGYMQSQTLAYNVPAALYENEFIHENKTFIGWSTEPYGEVEYIDKQIVVNILEDGNLDLYAIWADESYTVTFDYNGGTGSPDSKEVVGGEEYGVLPSYPTKYQHLFLGWYTLPEGGTRVYPDDIAGYEDITLYAQWIYSPANDIILDLVIRNNPDDNKDGIVDDIYLNFACSSYYEKFNVPIENLVVGQKYILTFTESNDAIFGKSSTGYGNAIYGSIITTNGTLSSGSIKSESISDGGLIAQFSDVSKGDEWLNGPRNWEMTFTAEDTTMYWTWDMGLIQDGSLYNYNFRNIKITPVQPEIEFSNKTIIKNSGSTAEITSQTNSTYSTEFSFDGDSGCEVVYYPITGLSSGLTYTIEFEHEFNGNLINSSSYDYGCGIMNSEPTSNPAKLSSLDIDSNKFILSSLSNDTEAVTLTFTATGDAAYWVWNMANCSDSEVGTVSIKVIGFSVEDSNGTSLEYDINVNASTFNLRRNTVNVVETVETSYIASASNASRIENDIISKTESDIASDSNASKTESDIASDSNASKD